MRKCYSICDFLSEDNKREMTAVCSECGFDIAFFENEEEASGKVSDCEVVYGARPAMLRELPDFKWCHTAYAGVRGYLDTGLFDSGERILTNSSGAYGRAIAEHIIMVTIMLMKQFPEYRKLTDARGWMQNLPSRSIADSRIAIIGTGDLGRNAAWRFRALGAERVIGFNRSGRTAEEFDAVYKLQDFEKALAEEEAPDVLVICIPGTPETERVISAERIALLDKKTFIVNVGRGWVIDQDALLDALNERKIAGAALDVMVPEPLPADHPLWDAPNTIITPHISGDMSLPHTVDITVDIFCDNLRRYVKGEELTHLIDVKAGY